MQKPNQSAPVQQTRRTQSQTSAQVPNRPGHVGTRTVAPCPTPKGEMDRLMGMWESL